MREKLINFVGWSRQRTVTESSQGVYFILDQMLYPNLLSELSAQPVATFDYLLEGTDFTSLAGTGPIWLTAQWGSALANWCLELCQYRHAGIVITATDGERALNHARWLLKVNDGSGGQSWVTYYQPALWAAMAGTTAPQAMPSLLGPWSAVYASSPNYISGLAPGWMNWQTDIPSTMPAANYFTLSPHTEPAYLTLRWVYWIDEQHIALHEPDVERLPLLIDNLNLLRQHQIYESAHLLNLADVLVSESLATQPAAMTILLSADETLCKVKQLQALNKVPASRRMEAHGTD
ncbi:DUF4123 domain-containing protein [Pseudomonas sp. PDM25]|uniref:DUF4123 domain-containing protein n=1 Tax=Pseudomonas sp. PDM25 TaxID=2854772 RepID=UPI001C44A7A6|nr:DUF4123 domain-containing protein [Pseudomonas sp. PDM25]MBV7515880.1 DUF4123 domain-containing protein [Pseudomonas sp. PDM25]